ncbi:MAG TPA: DUF4175 family protein [Bacteroidia bacterium]|jgi:hypothetical protein|nr:DUF4175 family protein [Bacteroidia bacterium]
MEISSGSYKILIAKLDEFIRKFYKNMLIRGLLYAGGILLSGFLVLAITEYFAHFDTAIRKTIFWGFLSATIYVLARFVAVPVFKLNRIGKIISHDEAADIIGKHFTNVQDKLLNVLQLHRSDNVTGVSPALIQASIDQKIQELKPVPFASAIDLGENKRHAKFVIIPFFVMLVILFTNAGMLVDSTHRLVHPGEYFETQAPFRFVVNGDNKMQAIENSDFRIDVKLTGTEIPASVYIEVDGNEYKLDRLNTVNFNYLFRNIQKTKTFRLSADGYTSREYTVDVLPNPIVLNFDVQLNYPKYLKKKDEMLRNTGDLVVPCGTKITWKFNTRSTKKFTFAFSDTSFALPSIGDNLFNFSSQLLESRNYSLHPENEFMRSKDSINYSINVIPDLYPAISVETTKDSASSLRMYFNGEVKDDYGFTKLAFVYHRLNHTDSTGRKIDEKTETVNLTVNRDLQRDQFYYFWDLSKLGITIGDEVEYYFEVWDNDGVHGAKSTRSQKMVFQAPTKDQLMQQNDQNNQSTADQLQQSLTQAQALQKDIEALYLKLMQKKDLSYDDRKQLENLLNRNDSLKNKIDQLKQKNALNMQQQSEYQPNDPDAQANQDEIENLFNQLSTEQMQRMSDLLKQLLQNANKDKTQTALDSMKQSNKDAQKDLDRTLNLFRDMMLQQKLDAAIQQLNDMQRQQDSLGTLSDQPKLSSSKKDSIKNAQDSLNKKFNDFRQQMDQIEQLNQQLEQPHDLPNTDLQEMQIQQQQREASQNSSQGANKKASSNQKNASQQMQQLSQQLQQAEQQMNQDEQAEDMQAVKQLLENLLQLSFDQEALMNDVKNTSATDPLYNDLARKQKKLKDDSKMIEDSLLALSKRNPQVSPTVNSAITDINMNMERAQNSLSDRNSAEAANREQQCMKSINDLALLLNESLENMMQQQQQQNNSHCQGGKCNKPGQGSKNKPGMSSLRQMQQQINGRIQQLQGQGGGNAEELAKLAAQQEFIRRMLEEAAQDDPNADGGPKPGGQTQAQMEQTETDLVNRNITAETIQRQQQIMDKLLEYEKAERQKEMDDQRQADAAKNDLLSNPTGFSEYNRQKQKEAELLKTVPPALSPYYKSKVNAYFNGVEQK